MASSNENDIVLDPFCGSATTGVAALRHGRNFVGVEAEKTYLEELAVKRIGDVLAERDATVAHGVREESAEFAVVFGEGRWWGFDS